MVKGCPGLITWPSGSWNNFVNQVGKVIGCPVATRHRHFAAPYKAVQLGVDVGVGKGIGVEVGVGDGLGVAVGVGIVAVGVGVKTTKLSCIASRPALYTAKSSSHTAQVNL
jgi:hypothetical protein